jgi:hypothetical protein
MNENFISIRDKINDLIEFNELLFIALGVDIKFDDFCKMDQSERKSLIRDIKINKIL